MLLRLAQIALGVGLVLLFSRGLVRHLDGPTKLLVTTLAAYCFGYLTVWSNTFILKSTETFGLYRSLRPSKWGHLVLPFGAVAIGFGYYARAPLFVLAGGGLFYAANWLLTRVEDSPFLKVMEEVDREREKLRVRDLVVTVTGDRSSQDHYVVAVRNTGKRPLENFRILYEPVLLDAENFGVDTTHMRSTETRIPGDPIHIETLDPGQSMQFVRKGWGDQASFDGLRECPVELVFEGQGGTPASNMKPWCDAMFKLPNARRQV